MVHFKGLSGCKGSNAASLSSLVVDERMRSVDDFSWLPMLIAITGVMFYHRLSVCLSLFLHNLKKPNIATITKLDIEMIRAHSFPRAAEFRAEPRNLAVAAEFPCLRGIP